MICSEAMRPAGSIGMSDITRQRQWCIRYRYIYCTYKIFLAFVDISHQSLIFKNDGASWVCVDFSPGQSLQQF